MKGQHQALARILDCLTAKSLRFAARRKCDTVLLPSATYPRPAFIASERKTNMFSTTSIRRKSRLKMIAGVFMTALIGWGAAEILPFNTGRSALAATQTPPEPQSENPERIATATPR